MIKFENVFKNEIQIINLIDVKYFDGEGDSNIVYSGNNGKFFECEDEAIEAKSKTLDAKDSYVSSGSLTQFLDEELIMSQEDWIDYWKAMLEPEDDYFSCFVNQNNEKLFIINTPENIESLLSEFNEFYGMFIILDDLTL